MLSRKQIWRKTRSNSAAARPRDGNPSVDDLANISESKSDSEQNLVSGTEPSGPKRLRSALNLTNMLSESDKARRPKDNRTMRFSSTVHICLIPSRSELRTLVAELFWRAEDYVTFKSDAVGELRVYLTANGITAREAIFKLYQPHDEERRQWTKCYESSREDRGEKDSETDKEESSNNSETTTGDEEEQEGLENYNSDDDDEPTYGNDTEGLNRFSGLKTDIELNAQTKDRSGSLTKMPTKTPSGGANSDNQHVWAVKWKPKAP